MLPALEAVRYTLLAPIHPLPLPADEPYARHPPSPMPYTVLFLHVRLVTLASEIHCVTMSDSAELFSTQFSMLMLALPARLGFCES